MPNLFPTETSAALPESKTSRVQFGKSWTFDFAAGDFNLTPTGKVAGSTEEEAWLEWCRKTLMTARYWFLIYSRNYGQEFDDLISRHLTRAGNESEIKRIATETLKVDPRTKAVENFTFTWEGDQCYFTCEVSNVRGETANISGQAVIG